MTNKISYVTIVAFALTFIMCFFIVFITVVNRYNVEKLEMEQVIMDKSVKISEVISKLLYKSEILSALVLQNGLTPEYFKSVAATIVDDPAILNVLIAPDGIVSAVYPLEGNEGVIGLDFLSEGAGNKEAMLAIETGSLVFGGPFTLVQGGEALVGRLPVYINSGADKKFWGLVSVTLKYPQSLDGVGLDILEKQGFSYEIWRKNPDTGERQVIANNNSINNKNVRFIEKEITIFNAKWYFRVAPVRMWYQYTETWLLVTSGLFISLLVAFVTQNNHELRLMKTKIEYLAQTDPMTGLFNRRYFMDAAPSRFENARKQSNKSYIIIFDIDHFKSINDQYGHDAGDKILIGVSRLVETQLHPYDLLARFGGEEFVVLTSQISESSAFDLAEMLRSTISNKKFIYENNEIVVTASLGIAQVDDSIEAALRNSDLALYKAKADGRNNVKVFG